MGYHPEDFYDDAIYPLLERQLPWLCADRLDYFLRDSLAGGISTPDSVALVLADLVVIDRVIAFAHVELARDTADRFAAMNREYWASPAESYIYNEFADALREGIRLGVLDDETLLTDDQTVLARLQASGQPADRLQAQPHPPVRPSRPGRLQSPCRSQGTVARPAGSDRQADVAAPLRAGLTGLRRNPGLIFDPGNQNQFVGLSALSCPPRASDRE